MRNALITIIDYNMGNLGSIRNMLRKVGVEAEVTADPDVIARATRLILPGVGSFDAGMDNLLRSGLIPVLNNRVLEAGIPILGICLGMQLMTSHSEEGRRPGLGWVNAHTLRFQHSPSAPKVPHMGWNVVRRVRSSPLIDSLSEDSRFYFVHSYYVRCADEEHALLRTAYGVDFDSAFEHGSIAGVQFHPEKSHKFGMRLLQNFALKFCVC